MNTEKSSHVIAYRCPFCGKGVISNEGVFSLTAERISLKCPCKCSELMIEFDKDDKLSVKAPCIFCPSPHTYKLTREACEARDIMTLSCQYSGVANVFVGELNHVKAELSRTELELLEAMSENGIESFDELQKKEDFTDSELIDEIIYVVKELYEEHKISCRCGNSESEYEIEISKGGVLVSCKTCGAEKLIPADSYLAAHAFLEADSLRLE